MKRLSLRFFLILFTLLFASISLLQFYSPPAAQAVVSSGFWTNRTPRTGRGFLNDFEYQRFGAGNSSNGAHIPFAELIEFKPPSQGGGQVIHWFFAFPNHGDWSYNSNINFPTIMHTSDQGQTWNRITPTDLKGCQINFKVVPETWYTNNDPTQSRWNGKLFLYADRATNPFSLSWYTGYRPALYRYDGNGLNNQWTNLISENLGAPNTSFNSQYIIGSAFYHRYFSYGMGFKSQLEYFGGKLYLVSFRISLNSFPTRARLAVHCFDGSTNDLLTSGSALLWTRKWESSEDYEFYPYYPPSVVFYFKKVDNYLFMATRGFDVNSGWNTQPESSPGVFWQSDTNGEDFQNHLPLPPIGRIVSNIIPYNSQWRYSFQFDLNIGGTVYRAYTTTSTQLIGSNGGDYGWTLRYNWRYTWWSMLAPWNYYYGDYLWAQYYLNRNASFVYSSIDHVNRRVYLTNIDARGIASPVPIPIPMSLEEYKGYAYAGFGHNSSSVANGPYGTGKLRRTNRFTDSSNNHNTFVSSGGVPNNDGFNNWADCGDIVDLNYPVRNLRQRNSAIVTLSKTLKPKTGGGFEDDLLYIGPSSWSSPWSQGWCAMFSTEGLDQADDDAVPVVYTLVDDEWWYDEDMGGRHFMGTGTTWNIYNIFSIMNSSIGQLVFFTYPASSRPGEPYWGQRNFQILNAAPSLSIDHAPKPFIIERGQSADLTFTLIPKGGFGMAGFRMQLIIDSANIYLPTRDPLGNPYTENQKFSTRLSQPGPLLFFPSIPWEVTPTLRTTLSQQLGNVNACLYVTDVLTNMVVPYCFTIVVRPPQPGFTASVIPPVQKFHAGDTVCFDVNIETRFDFEDNVIVGIFWSTPPPINDTDFEWKDSTYIVNELDTTMVEVMTRKNMGTQYQFCLHTEKTVTPGNWEFQLMFFSTVKTQMVKVRIQILPPQPTFTIDTMPIVGKTVPGGQVHYQIIIESIDNYVGPVNLHLENLPPTVEVVKLEPVTVNLTLAQPVAYSELVLQTFSAVFAPERPTNFYSKVISSSVINLSWTPSRPGTYEIAGYEIYRGPNLFIDKATKIADVGPNVVNYDDNQGVERGVSYYYFIRAYDNQIPPNYSDFVASNEAKPLKSPDDITLAAVANTGTLPGYYRFIVIGTGTGIDDFGQPYIFSVPANTDLLVYKQLDQMKTPAFDFWGLLLLMVGLLGFVFVKTKKKEQLDSY